MLESTFWFSPLLLILWKAPLAFILIGLIAAAVEELKRPRNLPPTPGNRRPLPFIGNVLDIPKGKSGIRFREWNEKFGPILTVWNGRVPTILVGDPKIAAELLDKRSHKYSSRPRSVVLGDLLTENKSILLSSYGERWRAYRRALHRGTVNKVVDTYLPVFEMEGRVLTASLLRNPEDWYNQISRYTASSVVVIAFGRRVTDIKKDAACQKLRKPTEFMIKMNVPGAQWHELFPWLQYIPASLNPIKRRALGFRKVLRGCQSDLMNEVRDKMKSGVAPRSFAKMMLDQRDKFTDLDDEEFNGIPGTLFNAGVDTTSSTLQSLILAMVLYPEVQKIAQEEISRTIGSQRSPTWKDEEQLPYVCAIIKEVLRWRPVTIIGISHSTTEDDYYMHDGKEYFIPKGATVQPSLWSINNNKRVYTNPDEFDPGRYLKDSELPGTGGKSHSSFGWGRRVCPGAYFAGRSLFHTTVRLLWAFKFAKAKSPVTGELIIPDASTETGYSGGFVIRPLPFPCQIEIRSEAIREIILREEQEALEGLKEFET